MTQPYRENAREIMQTFYRPSFTQCEWSGKLYTTLDEAKACCGCYSHIDEITITVKRVVEREWAPKEVRPFDPYYLARRLKNLILGGISGAQSHIRDLEKIL